VEVAPQRFRRVSFSRLIGGYVMKRILGKRSAFTLIELLVVIAIIAILAAILFPVFAQARDKARSAACLSNAKQIGTGMYMYVQDYDETFYWQRAWDECDNWGPGAWGAQYWSYTRWPIRLMPYLKNEGVFKCSSDRNPNRGRDLNSGGNAGTGCGNGSIPFASSYGANLSLIMPSNTASGPVSLGMIGKPAEKIFVAEAIVPYGCCEDWNNEYFRGANQIGGENGWTWAQFRTNVRSAKQLGITDAQMAPLTRHAFGNYVVFCDGHVKWTRWNHVPDAAGAVAERQAWERWVSPGRE